jgi:hypothetical protein
MEKEWRMMENGISGDLLQKSPSRGLLELIFTSRMSLALRVERLMKFLLHSPKKRG